MNDKDPINELVASLEPVRATRGVAWSATLWSFGALVGTSLLMMVRQPFREGVTLQLVSAPRFSLEVALGLIVCALLARAAFELAVPDQRRQRRYVVIALSVLALWLALFAITFITPVLAPSMLGKREACEIEVMLFGIPLTTIAIIWLRRLYVLTPVRTGLIAGLAGGFVPGLLMQLACMHDPWHALTHHFAPALVTGTVGALLGMWLLRERRPAQ